MAKSYTYELYFNFKRKNRYRGRKTPVDILGKTGNGISPQVFNLPPVILDNYIDNFIEGGYHVGLDSGGGGCNYQKKEFIEDLQIWLARTYA